MSKNKDMFAWNDAIQKMNELSKNEVKSVNKWDYLRGVNGIVVHVIPTRGLRFNLELRGKMGWSEPLIDTENGMCWGGSGSLKEFKTFDEALNVGMERVDELLKELKDDK